MVSDFTLFPVSLNSTPGKLSLCHRSLAPLSMSIHSPNGFTCISHASPFNHPFDKNICKIYIMMYLSERCAMVIEAYVNGYNTFIMLTPNSFLTTINQRFYKVEGWEGSIELNPSQFFPWKGKPYHLERMFVPPWKIFKVRGLYGSIKIYL